MRRLFFIQVICIFLPTLLAAQNPVLDAYISEGLNSNLGLRQQQLDYNQDLMALKEARRLFFPEVTVQARYTVADGGRVIDFPVGDLLNPVYSTLNLLTGSQQFPQIENESFSFYRAKEQETKVSLLQPIFSAELIQNNKIRKDAVEISRVSVEQYKRELVLEISRAYYNYQKAYFLHALADSTRLLVNENVRVNRSLYQNDKVTLDAVYRSEADQAMVEAQQAKARNMMVSGMAYFNFLLNRGLAEEITLSATEPVFVMPDLEAAQDGAVQQREELKQLRLYTKLNDDMAGLYKSKNLPGLYGAVDYGFQGETYSFTSDDDFVLASLVLKWDLFQGGANYAKIKQREIEGEKLSESLSEAEQKVRLDVINKYYAVLASLESIQAAEKQKKAASGAYRLISRKYLEEQASLLELIDARTSMTGASADLIVAENDYMISLAELAHAMGTVDISQYQK